MTRYIAIASGKGGAGKTTVALNLGLGLTNFGRDTIVVDANFQTPHIGLHLGSPVNPVSLNDVLKGNKHITEAIYKHSSGLKIVPLTIAVDDLGYAEISKLKEALEGLRNRCETVLLDSPAGFGREVDEIFKACDNVILIATPDLISVTDALKTKVRAEKFGAKALGVIINKTRKDKIEMNFKNIESMLGIPILEVIHEDDDIRHALHMKHPVTYSHQDSKVSVQFKKLAAKLLGQTYVDHIEDKKQESIYAKTLKRLGFK